MQGRDTLSGAAIEGLKVGAYTVPTDSPEADGTFSWRQTTLITVHVQAAGREGFGYSYADAATAHLIRETLAPVVTGHDAFDTGQTRAAMIQAVRNLGRPGVSSMAVAAVDAALWDLKGQLAGLPVVRLLGLVRDRVPVYGSGGFTSYGKRQLQEQLGGWVRAGIPRVKMKVGSHPEHDVARVREAREAVGEETELFVDANGAYDRKQALEMAARYAALGVTWFEEPVVADDLDGLRLLRDRAPAGMEIAAGEYGYEPTYFRRMLAAGAVDVLQADASRCAGITGFMQVDALCQAWHLPLSAHCAPSLHVHPCAAAQRLRHLEYFHDHVRIEHMLFDGALTPEGGMLRPDLSRPGLGLEFKRADARRFAVWEG
jgi:L-alanine-DL-glutamate epimerase-like enolase superfamily enzyme